MDGGPVAFSRTGLGSVPSLTILPLVDWYADHPGLRTEAGVSYLVRAGERTILFDLGYNGLREANSPLLANMESLGIDLGCIDSIFVSHPHADHLGGMEEARRGEFSLAQAKLDLGPIPVYAPVPLRPSAWNPGPQVEVLEGPRILGPGLASIGPIETRIVMGRVREHSLLVNVEGQGLVVIVGCGHQTIEAILGRVAELSDLPVLAVVGGLHFPVKGGRLSLGPINLQYLVGLQLPLRLSQGKSQVGRSAAYMKAKAVGLVSLSCHDSSDWSVEVFREEFGEGFVDLRVGREIRLGRTQA